MEEMLLEEGMHDTIVSKTDFITTVVNITKMIKPIYARVLCRHQWVPFRLFDVASWKARGLQTVHVASKRPRHGFARSREHCVVHLCLARGKYSVGCLFEQEVFC